ncbi:MAG: hydrogenase maturation protease [Asgard group archaeon]|nr:hydrogenase maturation protease [Asgard group archaeon]
MKIKGIKKLENINPKKKICIMGIGNFDRADDYIGVATIELLEKKSFPDNVKIINAGPVPEAFTGVIKKEEPDILIIIDAAQMDEKPGTIRIFTEENVDSAYMITPHKVSMTMYLKYLRFELKKLKALFIGIQPKSLSYMVKMDPNVEKSAQYISQLLEELLCE